MLPSRLRERRAQAEILRGYPLEAVARALGYRREPGARWRQAGSALSINRFMFYDHLRGEGGAIQLAAHALRCPTPDALDVLAELFHVSPGGRRQKAPPRHNTRWPALRQDLVQRPRQHARRTVPRPRPRRPARQSCVHPQKYRRKARRHRDQRRRAGTGRSGRLLDVMENRLAPSSSPATRSKLCRSYPCTPFRQKMQNAPSSPPPPSPTASPNGSRHGTPSASSVPGTPPETATAPPAT